MQPLEKDSRLIARDFCNATLTYFEMMFCTIGCGDSNLPGAQWRHERFVFGEHLKDAFYSWERCRFDLSLKEILSDFCNG